MNKLIIALSVACASACVFADATPYENLKFDTAVDWFRATAGEREPALSNLERSGTGTLSVEGDMLVVETEADPENMTAVTLTASAAVQDITTVTFTMLASTVPTENLTDMSNKGKIAFAISGEDSDRAFKAWLGGTDWVTLSGATVPADDASYTLDVLFDSRTGVNKVCFKVDDTVLKKAQSDDGWYGYGDTPVAKTLAVDLVGSGKIASIIGVQLPIKAEVIPIPDLGNVEIPKQIAAQYAATDPAPCKANVNVATAVALGIMKVENGNIVIDDNADFTVKADATARYSGAISVIFPNFPKNVPESTVIAYQLMGSTNGSNYEIVSIDGKETVDSVADVKIPVSAISEGKRYFKVVTKVTVVDSNAE